MSLGNANPAPCDLGVAPGVDPFAIQPGVILFDRFCVIGRVKHAARSWTVQVTDLQRKLGAVPHHRLELHILPSSEGWERAFRAALPAHQQSRCRIEGILTLTDGIGLLTVHADGPGLRLPLKSQDALTVARTLARLLERTHAVGVAGLRFDLRDIRLDVFGAVQFAVWPHVTQLRFSGPHQLDPQADAQALLELLHTLGDERISDALREVENRAQAIAQRIHSLDGAHPAISAVDALPAVPPFVGREMPLLRIQEAGARCRHSGVELFVVTGEPEIGRSRFLAQLDTDFTRGDAMWVLSAGFRQPSPHSGISVLLDHVADLLRQASARDREQIVARIQRRVGTSIALFNEACPALTEMIGRYTAVAPQTLDERSTRLAATVADLLAAIATPERPLVVLLDDIDQADASIRSVVYQLTIPTRTDPLLVVLSTRAGRELNQGSGRELNLPRPATEIVLGPLPLAALRTLLTTSLPGRVVADAELASWLFDAARGRPAAAWSLLQGWVDRGILARNLARQWTLTEHPDASDGGPTGASWSELGQNARIIAALALVRPEPATPGWLARVTGWTASNVREAATELVSASVLLQDAGGRLAFPDERARDRVSESATPSEIAAAHLLIARWMAQLGNASPAQRAWHEEHAAQPGTSDVLARLHLEAGETHLTQCDAVRALWHFDCALARTRDPRVLRSAQEGRADALLLQDRNEEALGAYLSVFDRTTEPELALRIANRVVHAFYLFGDEEACLVVADRALQSVGQRLPRNIPEAVCDVGSAIVRMVLNLGRRDPVVSDGIAMLHCWLIASVATSHPHVGLSSLFRGLAAARPYRTAAGAWARAFFSVPLAAAGLTGQMRRLLDDAEADARAAPDAMSLGVVLHLRGQNELVLGNYELGQAALTTAVQEFRRAGDLSVSVLTLATAAQFAMDREAASAMGVRLQDATAAAWRHRHRAILPLLDGMWRLVLAREGKLSAEQIASIDPSPALATDAFAVSGQAFSAMALLQAGQARAALSLARCAVEGYRRSSAPVPFLAIALVAHAEALIAVGDSPREARTAVRRLQKTARSVSSVRVASQLVSAKLAIREGRLQDAKPLLVDLVDAAAVHQEGWHVLEAHQLLSQVLAGHDAPQASAHSELAWRWSARLGGVDPLPPPTLPTPTLPEVFAPATEGVRNGDVPLWLLVDQLQSSFDRVLPPQVTLKISTTAGVRAIGSRERIELLIVNLVLAVRDTLDAQATVEISVDEVELVAEEAAQTFQTRVGRWGTVQVTVHSTVSSPGRGALAECRELCTACGGFFEVRNPPSGGLVLCAYLPAPEGFPAVDASRLVAVVHSDPRVRGALVEGIRHLGWTAVELPAGEPPTEEVYAVFGEADTLPLLSGFAGVLVPIVRRSEPASTRSIRVPFLVNELETLLADISRDAPSTIAAARRPE